MFTVFSFVDYSRAVNVKIISQLNRRFRDWSIDKEQDALNMLVKEDCIFRIDSQESLNRLANINLMHYQLGFEVCIQQLRQLVTILKKYEKPHMLTLK